jgi:hypothetical protein
MKTNDSHAGYGSGRKKFVAPKSADFAYFYDEIEVGGFLTLEAAQANLDEANAIFTIKKGADVYDYALAGRLRGFQRRGGHVNQIQGKNKKVHVRFDDALFTICDAMNAPANGAERQPYFGAVATADGLKAARAALKAARRK